MELLALWLDKLTGSIVQGRGSVLSTGHVRKTMMMDERGGGGGRRERE